MRFAALLIVTIVQLLVCLASQAQEPLLEAPGQKEQVEFPRAVLQQFSLLPGLSAQFRLSRIYSSVYVADPNIVDVIAQTDHSGILVAKKPGRTNVLIADESHNIIADIYITVNNFLGDYNRIEIHNKRQLANSSNFRCSPIGCESLDEAPGVLGTAAGPATPPN